MCSRLPSCGDFTDSLYNLTAMISVYYSPGIFSLTPLTVTIKIVLNCLTIVIEAEIIKEILNGMLDNMISDSAFLFIFASPLAYAFACICFLIHLLCHIFSLHC